MTPLSSAEQGALAAVSAALGVGATAFARMMSGNRRVDKVDAVVAVAAAYDRIAAVQAAQVTDVLRRLSRAEERCDRAEERCDRLEAELHKRDELIFQHISGRRHVPPIETDDEPGAV